MIINKQSTPPPPVRNHGPNWMIQKPPDLFRFPRHWMLISDSYSVVFLMFAVIRWDYFIVPYGSLCLPKFSFFVVVVWWNITRDCFCSLIIMCKAVRLDVFNTLAHRKLLLLNLANTEKREGVKVLESQMMSPHFATLKPQRFSVWWGETATQRVVTEPEEAKSGSKVTD